MSESKVTQKNKVIQLNEQSPKQCFDSPPTPIIAPQGPKKSKMTPKLSQNQMSELKETKKIKVVQLHEQTKQQLLNTADPKNSPIRHQKFKSNSKLCQNQKLELMKNKYCYCSVKLRVCVNSFSSSYASNISFIAIPCTCRSMISHNICFCRIFDIFSTDIFLQTDRPTDRVGQVWKL